MQTCVSLSFSCRDKLFCRLTCQLLKKNLKAAEAYMEGKRFRHAKGKGLFPPILAKVTGFFLADCLSHNKSEGCCRVT